MKQKRFTHTARRERRKLLAADVLNGMSYAAVAVKYGCTESLVRLACKIHLANNKRGAK